MGERPLDPRSVANYVLAVRRHFGYQTTNLELQKIVYFAHGKFLVSQNRKLVEGYFEAWEHGPVHPLLYREFSRFGADAITEKAKSFDLVTGDSRFVRAPSGRLERSHIVEIVLQLKDLTASQLRNKSHAEGGPWHSVMLSAKVNLASQVIIPDNVIRERYNRHILPIGEINRKDNGIEDQPPERSRSSKHFGASD